MIPDPEEKAYISVTEWESVRRSLANQMRINDNLIKAITTLQTQLTAIREFMDAAHMHPITREKWNKIINDNDYQLDNIHQFGSGVNENET